MAKYFIPLQAAHYRSAQIGLPDVGSFRAEGVTWLFGPFQTDDRMQEAMRRVAGMKTNQPFFVFDGTVQTATPSPLARPLDQRRIPGDFSNFVPVGDWYRCRDCDQLAVRARISHSELGEDVHEFPACPNCDLGPTDEPGFIQIKNAPAAV